MRKLIFESSKRAWTKLHFSTVTNHRAKRPVLLQVLNRYLSTGAYSPTTSQTPLHTSVTMSSSFSPSVVGTISDLDGFSVAGDNSFPHMQPSMYTDHSGDFGFDPPTKHNAFSIKMEQTYSPPEPNSPFGDFNFDPAKGELDTVSTIHALELDRMMHIPNTTTAVARFGQVTPPRSNSESSLDKVTEPKSAKQKRSTKTSTKEEPSKTTPTGRKRRNTRKNSVATNASNPEEDEKRKQSLEKNRLAAAKCRVNKKEKTEQLQRDSHDKAVQNAFLKEQVMRMKEEVQQMNALLLAHANCDGCRSPEDIQKHLNDLGNEFFTQHMSSMGHDFPSFANIAVDMPEMEHEHYFSPTTDPSLLNPPLPDFDREPEFDVSTPMHTD